MGEEAVLEAIAEGESAYGLLRAKAPHLERKFKKVDKAICDLLEEVKAFFPDAQYYTASGGFSLMLGDSHALERNHAPQQELTALAGNAKIGDGDF